MDHLDQFLNFDEFEDLDDIFGEEVVEEKSTELPTPQRGIIVFQKDTGKRVALFVDSVESIVETSYDTVIYSKSGKDYSSIVPFDDILKSIAELK